MANASNAESENCVSLRAAFSREEQSDVAGSNPQPRAAGRP